MFAQSLKTLAVVLLTRIIMSYIILIVNINFLFICFKQGFVELVQKE